MPVIRINDEGVEIEREKEGLRKKRAKLGGVLVLAVMAAASALYAHGSTDTGIFVGIWAVSLGSLLNLYAE